VRSWPVERWIAVATLAALGVYAVLGYRAAVVHPLDGWDSWSIWSRKGTMLLQSGSLPTAFLTSPDYGFMHPDYPMLLPLFESVWFRAVGGPDTQALHGQFWIFFIASLWAGGYLASRVTRPALWAPVIALVAVTPGVTSQLLQLYADIPMALFLALGALSAGLWLRDREPAYLVIGTLLLAAAANTKNEGLSAAVAVTVLALVLSLSRALGRRVLIAPAAALAGLVALVAPWRLWLGAHDIRGDMPVGQGLSPSYLHERTERVWPSIKAIGAQLSDQGRWNYLLPLALGLVIVCLATGVARRAAAFYGLAGLAAFATLVWAYWISPQDLNWHLSTSVDRTVDGMVFLGVAALLQLGGALVAVVGGLREPDPPVPRAEPAGEERERVYA
jgi:hypothetical protein